jgi:hypothetical protein
LSSTEEREEITASLRLWKGEPAGARYITETRMGEKEDWGQLTSTESRPLLSAASSRMVR